MSIVTNVILHCPLGEERLAQQIIDWLIEQGHGRMADVSDVPCGKKALECSLYIGAFNSLSLEDLVDFCRGLDWHKGEHPDLFPPQLFVMEQDDEIFTERLNYKTWLSEKKR